MYLTDRTDFSLRVLIFLALHEDERVSVRRIAESFRISEAHLAKCVQALAAHGFVQTTIGRGGGVRLARTPAEIRIGEVVRALEPMVLVECFGADNSCPIVAACGLIAPLARAKAAFIAVLDEATLADAVIRRVPLREALGTTGDG